MIEEYEDDFEGLMDRSIRLSRLIPLHEKKAELFEMAPCQAKFPESKGVQVRQVQDQGTGTEIPLNRTVWTNQDDFGIEAFEESCSEKERGTLAERFLCERLEWIETLLLDEAEVEADENGFVDDFSELPLCSGKRRVPQAAGYWTLANSQLILWMLEKEDENKKPGFTLALGAKKFRSFGGTPSCVALQSEWLIAGTSDGSLVVWDLTRPCIDGLDRSIAVPSYITDAKYPLDHVSPIVSLLVPAQAIVVIAVHQDGTVVSWKLNRTHDRVPVADARMHLRSRVTLVRVEHLPHCLCPSQETRPLVAQAAYVDNRIVALLDNGSIFCYDLISAIAIPLAQGLRALGVNAVPNEDLLLVNYQTANSFSVIDIVKGSTWNFPCPVANCIGIASSSSGHICIAVYSNQEMALVRLTRIHQDEWSMQKSVVVQYPGIMRIQWLGLKSMVIETSAGCDVFDLLPDIFDLQ